MTIANATIPPAIGDSLKEVKLVKTPRNRIIRMVYQNSGETIKRLPSIVLITFATISMPSVWRVPV